MKYYIHKSGKLFAGKIHIEVENGKIFVVSHAYSTRQHAISFQEVHYTWKESSEKEVKLLYLTYE